MPTVNRRPRDPRAELTLRVASRETEPYNGTFAWSQMEQRESTTRMDMLGTLVLIVLWTAIVAAVANIDRIGAWLGLAR